MKNDTVKTVGMMMAITLIGKIMGLGREMLFGFHYGTESIEAAAFTVANQIPKNFLDAMFASAISSSFIPVFNDYLEKKNRDEAYKLSYNFLNIIILFTSIITVIGIAFSYPIVSWSADGYVESTKILASNLLKILFPLLITSGIAYSLIGVVQSLGEFNIPAAMSIASNGIIIAYYFFFIDKFGIYGLAIAFILGWLSQILIQIPFLIKNKFKYRFYINFKDRGIRQIIILMIPVMLSTWIQPINVMINIKLASKLFNGSGAGVTALNYANTLYTVITGVFVLSIANVIFPKLAKQNSNDDSKGFGETLGTTLHTLFYFLIPMTLGMIILAKPIVKLVFQIEGGEFDDFSTQITAKALTFYFIGVIGFGIQTILLRGFFALKDGMTPLITGIVAIAVNLIFSIVLIESMDVGGPALASSISVSSAALIMLFVIGKKNKSIFNSAMPKDIFKMIFSAIIMAGLALVIRNYFLSFNDNFVNRVLVLAVPSILGATVYLGMTSLFKLHESQMILKILLKR